MSITLTEPGDQIATINVSETLTVGTFTDDDFVSGEWSGLVIWGDGQEDPFPITSQGVQTRSHTYVSAGTKAATFSVSKVGVNLEVHFNVTVPAPVPPSDITLNLDFAFGAIGAAGTDPAGSPAPGSYPTGGVVAFTYTNSNNVDLSGFAVVDGGGRAALSIPSGSRVKTFTLTNNQATYTFANGIPSVFADERLRADKTIAFRIWQRGVGVGVIAVPHMFRVVDADNNAISGASVWLGDFTSLNSPGIVGTEYGPRTQTDENGACERFYAHGARAVAVYAIATGYGPVSRAGLTEQGEVVNDIVLPTLPASPAAADHAVAVTVTSRDVMSRTQGTVWLTSTANSTVVSGPVATTRQGCAILFCNKNTTYRLYFRDGKHVVENNYHQFTTANVAGSHTAVALTVVQPEEAANTGDFTITLTLDSLVGDTRTDIRGTDFVAYLTSDTAGLVRETEILGGDTIVEGNELAPFTSSRFVWDGIADGTYYAWVYHPYFVPIIGEAIVVNGDDVSHSISMHPVYQSSIDGDEIGDCFQILPRPVVWEASRQGDPAGTFLLGPTGQTMLNNTAGTMKTVFFKKQVDARNRTRVTVSEMLPDSAPIQNGQELLNKLVVNQADRFNIQ